MRWETSSLLDNVSAGRVSAGRMRRSRQSRRSQQRLIRKAGRQTGLALEPLEGRALLATFTVTANTDTLPLGGPGELRTALNAAAAGDDIQFQIAVVGTPQTITLSGPLPTIGVSLKIDGTTQGALVTIDGSGLGAGVDGIDFAAGSAGSIMQGLELANFSRYGTVITAPVSVTLQNNLFTGNLDGVHSTALIAGTAITGNIFQGHGDDGIDLTDAGAVSITGNTVTTSGGEGIVLTQTGGGTFVGSTVGLNKVSGSIGSGLLLSAVTGTTVGGAGLGNTFNTNTTDGIRLTAGDYDLGLGKAVFTGNTISHNTVDGVRLTAGGVRNLVLGTSVSPNTIDSNGDDGIQLAAGEYGGTVIDSNLVRNNVAYGLHAIGAVTSLDVVDNTFGAGGLPNANGIGLVGGDYAGAFTATQLRGNTIADNTGDGVLFLGAVQNLVVGTPAKFNTIDSNGSDGLELPAGSYAGTTIDSNAIDGNTAFGINLTGAATGLSVVNNTIGTLSANADGIGLAGGDHTGTQILSNTIGPNTNDGIVAAAAVTNLTIGSAGNINTIENNGSDGIELPGGSFTGTAIDSNTIRGNTAFGINLTGAATSLSIVNNTIGQSGAANADGIGLAGGDYTGTQIFSNTIDSNTNDGIVAAGAVTNLTIGSVGNANIIENNGSDGIELASGIHTGTAIDSNTIRGNAAYGILTAGGTPGLQILSNTIGAVGSPNGTGIGLGAGDSTGAQILGNTIEQNTFEGILTLGGVQNLTIGTLASPNTVQANGGNGIEFATGDYTGTVVQANTVATNGDIGIAIDAGTKLTVGVVGAGNTVTGNTNIGIGAQGVLTGTRILANTVTNNPIGIGLDGPTGLAVGGVAPGEGNTITGSSLYGLGVRNATSGTTVYGNTMTGNAMGVGLSGASGITIGGPAAGQANTIDANTGIGLGATGLLTGATVRGNSLQNNATDGVSLLAAQGLTIGGTAAGESNTIDFNGSDGVEATGDSTGTTVLGNEIRFNTVHGVNLVAATNLTIGGTVLGAGNTIQSNGAAGVFAGGTSTGSAVLGNLIDANQVGVDLLAAQGLTVDGGGAAASNTISGNTIAGVRAAGDNAGTSVRGNLVTGSPTGVLLSGAQNLIVGSTLAGDGNRINSNTTGVASSGNASGTVVLGNIVEGNNTGVSLAATTNLTIGGDSTTGAGNLLDGNATGVTATGTLTGTRVIGNTIVDGLTGVNLSNAVNLAIGDTGSGEGNAIENQALEGIKASGVLNGTTIRQNTIDTSDTGILLSSATNLTVGGPGANEGNTVEFNVVGLDAFGTLSGTVVQGNDFLSNQTGVVLQDLVGPGVITNLTFGGTTAAAGNLVSGNGQTGLFAEGDLSGTTIRQNTISANGNGVGLFSARNLAFGSLAQGNAVTDNLAAGIYATGDLSGTSLLGNAIDRNVAGAVLQNANNLVFGQLGSGNSLDDNTATGIWAGGNLTGTSVTANLIDGLGVGVGSSTGIGLDNATGITIGGATAGQGNTVGNQSSSGLFGIGNLAGTTVRGNAFNDGKLGITLVSATNGSIGGSAAGQGNTVERNTDAGLYAAGDFTGTTVRGNGFTDNTTQVLLVNATNLAFGGTAAGAGNTTVGGGTGLYATGDLSGTTVFNNDIESNGTAVGLFSATNLTVGGTLAGAGNLISGVISGLFANGPLTGTSVLSNVIRSSGAGSAAVGLDAASGLLLGDTGGGNDIRSTGPGGVGLFATGNLSSTDVRANLIDSNATGVSLVAATGLTLGGPGLGNTISNSLDVGLRASGVCTGSSVLETNWVGNPVNVQSTATGLTIAPPAP
jgi:hypothetical protein